MNLQVRSGLTWPLPPSLAPLLPNNSLKKKNMGVKSLRSGVNVVRIFGDFGGGWGVEG